MHPSSSTQCRRSRTMRPVLVAALVVGLLIWAKLRLVAGIPRTVLAEPRDHAATQSAPAPHR